MRRQRGATREELALWHHAVRDAAPLRPGEAIPPPAVPESPPAMAPPFPPSRSLSSPAPAPNPTARRLDPSGPVDLDRRSWLRLRRGRYPIDARLDLHGLNQVEAHGRLAAFLSGAQARGNRCVLVITGRGLRYGGTLREMTPRWLEAEPNRRLVLSFSEARLQHGGEGALYVLLRRRSGR
ncbi:MAG: Smr/MutS family protein [Geminicoccaceae bacterium]